MKKIIYVQGMHCISCELLLSKELKSLKGLEVKNINYKSGELEVIYKDELQLKKAIGIIEKHNFTVIENKNQLNTSFNLQEILIKIIILLTVGIILYITSIIFDFTQYIPQNNSLNYTATILLGIVASLSTCLAITGAIIIGFSKTVTHSGDGLKKKFLLQFLFHLGRIGGFFIMGGILGLLGEIFSINLQFTTILTIVVAFLLMYMGLQILGFLPNITKFGIHLPKYFSEKILAIKHPKYAPLVGFLTFFLPCGFTQTVQLMAISSGDFLTGALLMSAFALGTLPVLFFVGLSTSYFSNKKFPIIELIIGSVIFIFGIITFSNAYNLLPSIISSPQAHLNENISDNIEFTTLHYTHNGWNLDGNTIDLESGKNYEIIITPTRDGMGCMGPLTIPTLDSNKIHNVRQAIPIIYKIVDAKPGVHKIVCSSMGMVQGAIIIK